MKKILFVDDSYFQRVFMKEGFHDIPDIEASTVESQKLALQELEEEEYDWLLSDFEMEPMEPLDYFKKVMELKGKFQIIVISGKIKPNDKEELQKLGIKHILEKPFNFDDIMSIIKNN